MCESFLNRCKHSVRLFNLDREPTPNAVELLASLLIDFGLAQASVKCGVSICS